MGEMDVYRLLLAIGTVELDVTLTSSWGIRALILIKYFCHDVGP